MPFYRFGDFAAHVRMPSTKSRPAPPPCRAPYVWSGGTSCCAMSTRVCDAPVGDGTTCDMPLCDSHAMRVAPDVDLCPKHAEEQFGGGPKPRGEAT